ncbi:hypothetical protein [Microvirga thermotolerans]|uniref:Uncharacterized protein n=1 Tax=Microvirga thermotolerans TaxID=2651334 RepID=A0A5P9JT14_9HYPH|nr:hypothetical protein [Microvirga thermotolerans]QFU15777.1 hypothetical protein GDR74_05825 [Microvirga thermotolerans]
MPERGEPSLKELLSDPIVRQLMARDGTSERQVRSIALSVRRRMALERRLAVAAQIRPPSRPPRLGG